MIDIFKIFHSLRNIGIIGSGVGIVLREMAEKLGQSPKLYGRIEEDWDTVRRNPGYPHFQAVAQTILNLKGNAPLEALDSLMQHRSDGRSADIWIPTIPAQMIAEIARDATSVRCSFEYSLHPAIHVAQRAKQEGRAVEIWFVSENAEVCDLATLFSGVLGLNFHVSLGQPFCRQDGHHADFEICFPPFNHDMRGKLELPKRTLDQIGATDRGRLDSAPLAVADVLAQAPLSGAFLSVPAGAFFRTVGIEAVARDELINSGRLKAALSAPPGMIYSDSSISAGFLVLEPKNKPQDTVRIIDLANPAFAARGQRGRALAKSDASWETAIVSPITDETVTRDVTISQIRTMDGILTADRYLKTASSKALDAFLSRYKTAPLSDLVDIIRPVALPKVEDGELVIYEASPGDVSESGYLACPEREIQTDQGGSRRARNQQVLPGDVLLSVKGTIGKVGIVPKHAPDTQSTTFWTAGQSIVILRARDRRIAPEALYEYLSNALVHDHLNSLAGGTAIQSLNSKDVKGLAIPLLNQEEQRQVEEAFYVRQTSFERLFVMRQEIARSHAGSWPHSALQPDQFADETASL